MQSLDEFVKDYKENFTKQMVKYQIPPYMHEGLLEYIVEGRPTGSFLYALLSNDMMESIRRADDENQRALVNYVKLLHNHAPIGSFGSENIVQKWKEKKGLRGVMQADADKHKEAQSEKLSRSAGKRDGA